MSKTEIAIDLIAHAVFEHITSGKAHLKLQRSISEDEVIQVFISTIKMGNNICFTKPAQLYSVFVNHLE